MRRLGWLAVAFGLGCELDRTGPGYEGGEPGPSSTTSDTSEGDPSTSSTTSDETSTSSSSTSQPNPESSSGSESTTHGSSTTTEGESSSTTSEPVVELPGFGPPVLETALNSPQADDDPTLRTDLLELVFASTRQGGGDENSDLYVSTREQSSDPWSVPQRLAALSTGAPENTPKISPDGLLISFSRDVNGSADIFIASRPSIDAPWQIVQAVDELSQADAGETGLVGTENLLHVYFCSNQSGDDELYRAERSGLQSPFDAPVRLGALGSDGRDCTPWVDPLEQVIVFASNRFDETPGEDDDLVWATLPDGEVQRVDVEFTTEREEDPWLAPDFSVLYFARGIGEGQDIYRAERVE